MKFKKTLYLLLFTLVPIVGLIVFFFSSPTASTNLEFYLNKKDYQPTSNTLVIIPILTANAYKENGFYWYYGNKCGEECLTVTIDQGIKLQEQASGNTVNVLRKIGYGFDNDYILDYYLRTNPDYLKNYDRIIVLHSEYVTQRIFDALQKHPKVIYLNPNALYGMVEIHENKMTLIQGHGYKVQANGFDWKYENTPLEYEKECKNWKFEKIENGYQLNCNPELTIYKNFELLKVLRNL